MGKGIIISKIEKGEEWMCEIALADMDIDVIVARD